MDDEHGPMRCAPFKNVWKVVSGQSKEVLGFILVYVGGVIRFGSTAMVKKIIDAFKEPWKCR
eukprot:8027733-Prorocentrum_lima.AAC.1